MEKTTTLIGRLFLGHIFLIAGIQKITGYGATQAWMESMGVPGMLLPAVIALEIGGGAAVIVGWQTRWAAITLAGFSILAAAIFHNNFADQMQMINFMKDIAIAGGLLFVFTFGPGGLSFDERRRHSHRPAGHTAVLP